jgi:hypothetical protein
MPPPPTLQLGSSERATFGLSSETVSDEVSLPYIDAVSAHELKAAETMVQEEVIRLLRFMTYYDALDTTKRSFVLVLSR